MSEVWCELDESGRVCRIFKNTRNMLFRNFFVPLSIVEVDYSFAVKDVRDQIWDRCEGECEWCAKRITKDQFHMHEQMTRGEGGEISLENSVGICYDCHFGPQGHGDRQPRFGEKNE